MSSYVGKITLRHVQLGRGSFRNFAGRKTAANKSGKRIINLFLDDALGAQLKDDGWKVKYYIPKTDSEDADPKPVPFLEAELRYDNYPPEVKLKIGDNTQLLDEEDLVRLNLDNADVIDVDARLSPYTWIDDDGTSRIKAYVDKLLIRMEDDFWDE